VAVLEMPEEQVAVRLGIDLDVARVVASDKRLYSGIPSLEGFSQ
jgi:hypothetical protein